MIMLNANRGFIYKYDDGKSTIDRYVLVVSNQTRSNDYLISTLMLGDKTAGNDIVWLRCDKFKNMVVHCGMVTYTRRECLVEEICEVAPFVMEEVDFKICEQLGLSKENLSFYKNAYDMLVTRIIEAGKDI